MVREWKGYTVPVRDAEHILERRVLQADQAVASISQFCSKMRVMVQAGGNWGCWPLKFSKRFETVYTFEPDPICFTALVANTADCSNVVRLQAALGQRRKLVGMRRSENTTGSQRVDGEGILPTIRIDDLGLAVCDLIYLDIEGMEFSALLGGAKTLKRCRPVVTFEDRPFPTDALKEWMKGLGYRVAGRIGSDTVMAC